MFNTVVNTIYNNFAHLLMDIDQPYLSQAYLKFYADAIHAKGAALGSCWGFVDGTVRPICRPTRNQKGHLQWTEKSPRIEVSISFGSGWPYCEYFWAR